MDKDNKIKLGGVVRKIQGGGVVIVELENNTTITCHVSGKMKKYNVHVILGDKVDVEISPFDLTKGRIVKRHLEPRPVDS